MEESIRVMSAWSLQGGGALKLLMWTGRATLQLSTLRLHIHVAQHRAVSLRGLALRRTVLGKTDLPSIGEAWEVAPAPGGVALAFDGHWCHAELAAFEEERPPKQKQELCSALGMSVVELCRQFHVAALLRGMAVLALPPECAAPPPRSAIADEVRGIVTQRVVGA